MSYWWFRYGQEKRLPYSTTDGFDTGKKNACPTQPPNLFDGGPMNKISLNDISIRTELQPGDIGDILSMHGRLYYKEYGYTGPFEMYVAQSLAELIEVYNP